jgi:SAM-dependent methyltransferase
LRVVTWGSRCRQPEDRVYPPSVDEAAIPDEDRAFADLFASSGEFRPGDKEYAAYRNFNLRAVERGKRVVELLRAFVSVEGGSVLDIGAGSGGLAIAFAKSGASVYALEPDPTRFSWAKARIQGHGVDVVLSLGVAENLNYPDARFDIVLLDSVIEHVENPEAVLAEVARVLRPGGVVYITWPNRASIINILHDPHYQMFGVVLMPRWLGRLYVERVRRISRGYWVNRIPSRRWLTRQFAGLGVDLSFLDPEGLDKLANPERMSRRYPWIRRAARAANAMGVSAALRRVAIAQYPGPSAVGRKR